MKTKKVLYTVSTIFSHHIAHTFLPQSFDFHHFTTHIYPYHYTPLSALPYAALHCTMILKRMRLRDMQHARERREMIQSFGRKPNRK